MDEIQDISIILELQSPFRWRPVIRNENRHEFDMEQEDAGTFSFLNFCALIVQVYDDYMNRGKTSGDELLKCVEKKLQELENSNCQDELYMKSKDAINHVFLACKTQMAIFAGKFDDEVTELMRAVKKPDDMNPSNKAAMSAIKACVHSLYSSDGLDISLHQIKTAVYLDHTTAYWMFLKGYILLKQRPTTEVPTLQEREAFNAAYKQESSNPLFMVYYADSLRETCKYRQKTYLWFVAESAQINPEKTVDERYETALDLYRKSYELRPNCPVVAFKCANGLMRLPSKYLDAKLIKKIISDCEKKFANSGFGALVCALYHERINHKIALSRRCLEKCVELNLFNGCINLIRMDFLEKNEDSNVVERLQKMLDVFAEPMKQEIIISQLISYFVFISNDIEKACEYMIKYYRTKSSGRYLEKHRSCFKQTGGEVSLKDVITDQVKLKLKDRQLQKEKRKFYNEFVQQMNFHNVEVLKGNPKNLLEQIQKSAVPKGKHPNKVHSNEAQRNSSSKQYRQSDDRSRYTPRNGDPRRREDGPQGRREGGPGAGRENVQRNNANPRSRDATHPRDGEVDRRPASFDKRPNAGYGGHPENVPKNDAGPRRGYDRRPPEERRTNQQPASSGEHGAAVRTKATKSDSDEYQLLMNMCREGNRRDLDSVFEKWKLLTLEDSKSRSEIPRTVPEEYECQQVDHQVNEVVSKRHGQRLEDHSLENRRCDRSLSEANNHSPRYKQPNENVTEFKKPSHRSKDSSSKDKRHDRSLSEVSDRSHGHKHRYRKPSEDLAVLKEQTGRSENGSTEGRRRDRSLSAATDHSHRHRKSKKASEDVAASKERSRRSEDGSVEDRRRDRSSSVATDRSRRHKHRHRKHEKRSESEDERHRHSSSPRRHRRRSDDRHGRKSHRRHRYSESGSDLERSVDRHSRKSHRKHRKSESLSDDRSIDRQSEKEKRSKKKHSSTEGHHEERRSHRDHKKSSRRKKESKRGDSESERNDSR